MKNAMRILSMLLAILMVLSSMVVATTVSVSAEEDHGTQPTTWWHDQVIATYGENATPTQVFGSGDGTSDSSAYCIDSPIQLAYFAYYLESGALNGKTTTTYFYIRGNDCNGTFDMSAHQWRPIGSVNTTSYTFKLSGRDTCRVKGLKLTASPDGYVYNNGCGMFALMQGGSVVENLTLDVKILNPVLGSSANLNTAAGVAGILARANNATIRNCNVNIDLDVNGTGGSYIYAGVVARLDGGSGSLTNTKVKGSINVTAPTGKEVWVAGAIGFHEGYVLGQNLNSAAGTTNGPLTNEASVSVTSNARVLVGGVGATSATVAQGGNLVNKGAINVNLTGTSTTYSAVGGIFAAPRIFSANNANLTNGESGTTAGSITVTTAGALVAVGGIAGMTRETGFAYDMANVTNYGAVTLNVNAASGDSTNPNCVGGIFGKFNASKASKMQTTENVGKINVVFPSNLTTGTATAIGGLVGYQTDLAITNSKNSGAINVTYSNAGTQYVGGISGHMNASTNGGNVIGGVDHANRSDYVINAGAITLTDAGSYDGNNAGRYIGGVVGYFMSTKLSGCINTADITYNSSENGSSLAGIAAVVEKDNLIIEHCINSGNLLVSNNRGYGCATTMGGVVATMQKIGTVDNCINTGTVRQTKGLGQVEVKMGGIAGIVQNGGVQNSTNSGLITIDNLTKGGDERHALRIGGVVGYAYGSGSTAVYTNLVNNGELIINVTQGAKEGTQHGGIGNAHMGSYVAGVIGRAEESVVLTNLTNNAKVLVSTQNARENDSSIKLGGVANLKGSANATNLTNNGPVELSGNYGAILRMGGVVGELIDYAVVKNAVNTADVTADKKSFYGNDVGGIVGYMISSATLNGATNSGDVSTVITADSDCSAGGIIGIITPAADALAKPIVDCFNYGDVYAEGLGNNAIAGIIGRVTSGTAGSIKLLNCVTTGNIKSGSLSGGVIGHARSEAVSGGVVTNPYTIYLENCISYGTGVTYSLVGSLRNDALVLKNCFGNTEYFLNYYNQNGGSKNPDGNDALVTVNGKDISGNALPYNPDDGSCAHLELATLDKARVRLDALGTDESGIRFDSYIGKDCYDEIKAMTGVSISIGTMIAPTQNLAHAPVAAAYDKMAALDALGGTRYTTVAYAQDFLDAADFGDESGSKLYFAGALNNIKEKNFNLSFSAIAYITITIGDFTCNVYADYDVNNAERARSIAQVAGLAFEDRATASTVIDGIAYKYRADEDNACYLGDYSLYSNAQLAKLKAFSAYDNTGKTAPEGLSVNGVSISEYKIVYAQSPIYKTYGSKTGKTLIGDLGNVTMQTNAGGTIDFGNVLLGATYDYDYQSAIYLQSIIYEKFGVMLEVVPDFDFGGDASVTSDDVITPEGEYEILVGQTNRTKTQSLKILSQTPAAFTLMIDDNDIIICGGSYGATWHAVEALNVKLGEIEEGADYNLKMAGNMSGMADISIIACIGDSITRGSQGLPDNDFGGDYGSNMLYGTANSIYLEQFLSYPANLQRAVWKDAYVYNFGRGNSTAGNYGDAGNYYANSEQWQACCAASDNAEIAFDLVFMMHGTNDSGRANGAYNWDEAQKKAFRDEVQAMMDKILEGSPDAKFVFNNIPHRFDTDSGTEEHNTMAMAGIQKEMAEIFAATGEYEVYHYNMNLFIRENLVKDGTSCDCEGYDAPAANFDSTAEMDAHGYFYNCETPTGKGDGTHPNFRGYNKMADGIYEVVAYVLFDGEKPVYMIDVQ